MTNPLACDLDDALQRLDGVWDALDGASILITGGSGFFGCWMLETLLWAIDAGRLDARVDLVLRDADGFGRKAPHLARHAAVRLLPGDIRAFEPAEAYTHVAHMASTAGRDLGDGDPLEIVDTLAKGTGVALAAARRGRARFLYTGSGRVYGDLPAGMTHVPETYQGGPDPMAAGEIMSEAKRVAETLTALATRDGSVQGLVSRGFAFVGPYFPIDSIYALGNFIADALAGRPITVQGDGTPVRSYMYGSDLAVWLWTMLAAGASGRAYNTGSEAGMSLAEVASRVGAIAGVPVVVMRTPDPARPVHRYVPDTTRARTELGLRETVGLDDAIRRTLAWHRLRT